MTEMIHMIEAIGQSSLAPFWVPLWVWTGIWAAVTLVLRLTRRADPSVRYRSAQMLLLSLPAGLMAAAAVPSSWVHTVPAAVTVLGTYVSEAAGSRGLPALAPSPSGFMVDLILGVGVLVWVTMASAALLGLAHRAHTAGRLLRALLDTQVASEDLAGDVSTAARAMGLRRVPRVVVTSAEVVPMTLGVWRPVVIVPASLNGRDRRLALTHEFAHVARRDPLAQYAEAVTAAVFAAHPAVRHLARECSLLRELACDAAVLDVHDVHRPAYAALLHRYAVAGSRPPVYAVGIADGPFQIHHRLTAMTHPIHRCSRTARAGLVTLLTLVAGLAMTAGSAFAQSPSDINGTGSMGAPSGAIVGAGIVGVGTVGPATPIPQPTALHPGRPLLAVIQVSGIDTNSALLSVLREDSAYVEHRSEGDGALTIWFAFVDAEEQRAWLSDSSTLERLDTALE